MAKVYFSMWSPADDNPYFYHILHLLKQGSAEVRAMDKLVQLAGQVESFLLSSTLFLIIYEARLAVTERKCS